MICRPKRRNVFVLMLFSALAASACGDDQPKSGALECAGAGELHVDHCHCDTGYEPTSDGLSCVKLDHDHKNNDHENNDHENNDHENNDHENNDHENNDHENNEQNNLEEVLSFMPGQIQVTTGILSDGSRGWRLRAVDGATVMTLEIFEAYGGQSEPGEVVLGGAETSYETCGTCFVLETNCVQGAGGFRCGETFMPRQGSVSFSAVGAAEGERLTGVLSDVVFQEVRINPTTFVTSVVEEGAEKLLNSWAFDAPISVPANNEVCSGHGHLHGTECHCDPGYKLDPNDSSKCIPN